MLYCCTGQVGREMEVFRLLDVASHQPHSQLTKVHNRFEDVIGQPEYEASCFHLR